MSAEVAQIRRTPTNSGIESKGVMKFFGFEIEGRGYMLLLAGGFGSMLLFVVLLASGLAWYSRTLVALVPLAGAIAYQFCLVQGKPPSYVSDLVATLFDGPHFFTNPHKWTRRAHPLGLAVRNVTLQRHGGRP